MVYTYFMFMHGSVHRWYNCVSKIVHGYKKKSRIRGTLNLSTDADSSTNTIFLALKTKKNFEGVQI